MELIVAITGASGANLGLRFVHLLPSYIKVHLIISNSAKKVLSCENDKENFIIQNKSNITYYNDNQLDATIASGSYKIDNMIVVPCSMNTLAKCTIGISDTLITRVFCVMLKERRRIILAPREMPYSTISLENMQKLSLLGVIIAPPILGYYSKQTTLKDMENFIIGKWFDILNIENNLYKRWNNEKN